MKQRILVTGAAGSIGSELVRQLHKDHIIYALDINETGINDLFVDYGVVGRVGNIRDYETVNDVFSDFKPDVVYHAAAYKTIEQMELMPLEAIKTNVIGTHNLLHCAGRFEVPRFVTISTDKVVNATSVMGQSKKLAETLTLNQGYTVVRFGNVLGSRGSILPIWERQINKGGPVTVTDVRMERFAMTIEEAVSLVIEAGNKSGGKEIWIMDMGEPIKILDLAKRIIQEARKEIEIKIIGMRAGETLSERLMTVEEEAIATKQGRFFVIKY